MDLAHRCLMRSIENIQMLINNRDGEIRTLMEKTQTDMAEALGIVNNG